MIDIFNDLSKNSKILIVEPHPDDACLGCHQLIKTCNLNGIAATVYTVTLGEAAYGYHSSTLANERSRETANYMAAFNIQHIQRNWPDGQVNIQDQVRSIELTLYSKLHCFIRNSEFTHVFTTAEFDKHPDHAYVGSTAKLIADALPNTKFFYYDSTTALQDFTHYAIIDEYSTNAKAEAMNTYYPSQVMLCPTFITGFAGLAAYRGMQVSAYVEDITTAEVYKLVS